jgi:uncharacterized protein (DUF58 family)
VTVPDPHPFTASTEMLPRLEWRVRHAVETMLAGDYRSVFRGRGMEFDQVVKYHWGDDLRDIDWNVTARLGEPYRKKFTEEREVSVILVFEDSPALQFGSAGRTRRETLLELASLLMLIGSLNRDRIGLLYASPETTWFRRPLPGRETTLHTASLLLGQPPPSLDAEPTVELPWHVVLRAASRQSVLVWLGPFSPGPAPDEWSALCRRYQTVGFRADDPWDLALPAATRLPIFDPIAGRVTEFDTSSTANRAAHAEWVHRREDHFSELFRRAHERQAVRNDEPAFEAIVQFFHQRARLATMAH